MKRTTFGILAVLAGAGIGLAQERVPFRNARFFEEPRRLEADGVPIRVESPGYACPTMADLDGDGVRDLLVGQFAEGKIAIYRGLGKGRFGKRAWVTAGGEPVRVPGVW